jgi:uncharacterized protein with HEPN domain
MPKRNVRLYLDDIRTEIKNIEAYVSSVSFGEFAKNTMMIDAIVRNFAVIGEGAKNLPDEFKAAHSEIPWGQIMGMRNKVVHEYFGIDEEMIWKTIEHDIPVLKSLIEKLVDE